MECDLAAMGMLRPIIGTRTEARSRLAGLSFDPRWGSHMTCMPGAISIAQNPQL